jgi:DNA-binding transcriptional ArsR family regulator
MADVQRVLAALSSPVRREILALIWERELPAGEIAAAFAVTPPTVSQHLAVLREAGLVTMTAQANFRRYRARQDALRNLHGALAGSTKWVPADDIPETALARAEWMGVPVQIRDGRFSCTMEWGTRVEGLYERVDPPHLIALRWDFDDDNVPIPGGEMVGYMRFSAIESGTHVEVHQLLNAPQHAAFVESAWTMVLGRLKSGVVAASDRDAPAPRRARRAKQRRSA